ncbi:esterase family protein [Paenibacillus sp. NEAU-GSW1]|uniref:alpha/beta hydrolase n=1 Tax=Paenibacillus sp. NEAU-GSW1 TaxID=2682486 RepID=UPI0012E0F55C|nr:alpha/beta hydrolase-fold protein [Paenibacillus sp. NEAU-GSW1]MUT65263.1 esterase [Paenibacillus sp. NEAU-GSW1]
MKPEIKPRLKAGIRLLVGMLLVPQMLLLAGCGGGSEIERMMVDASGSAREALSAEAQAGELSAMQHLTIASTALGKAMKINVYLPEGYSDGKDVYPVLYALHGKNGNENSFFANGLNMGEKAAKLAREGRIKPMIIVAPQLDNSYGVNSAEKPKDKNEYQLGMYEDFLIKEVIPAIDASFNTIKSREGRYIGGISMGGYAALHLAFTYPSMFSKVGGHSAAVWEETPEYLTWLYGGESTQEEVDPVRLAAQGKALDLAVYLDHGSKEHEHIAAGNKALIAELDKTGASYEFHTSSGGHNNKYWAAHIEDYLLFYDGTSK